VDFELSARRIHRIAATADLVVLDHDNYIVNLDV